MFHLCDADALVRSIRIVAPVGEKRRIVTIAQQRCESGVLPLVALFFQFLADSLDNRPQQQLPGANPPALPALDRFFQCDTEGGVIGRLVLSRGRDD